MMKFDLYESYIGNYKNAMETIVKCKNANEQFAKIMEQVQIFLMIRLAYNFLIKNIFW